MLGIVRGSPMAGAAAVVCTQHKNTTNDKKIENMATVTNNAKSKLLRRAAAGKKCRLQAITEQ